MAIAVQSPAQSQQTARSLQHRLVPEVMGKSSQVAGPIHGSAGFFSGVMDPVMTNLNRRGRLSDGKVAPPSFNGIPKPL